MGSRRRTGTVEDLAQVALAGSASAALRQPFVQAAQRRLHDDAVAVADPGDPRACGLDDTDQLMTQHGTF